MQIGSELYRRNRACRLCHREDLDKVLSLTATPPANACVSVGELDVVQPRFPLDVAFCRCCGHLQLIDEVDPAYLFSHYVYASGAAPAMIAHLKAYGAALVDRLALTPDDFVIEIGSNDGTFLRVFKEAGCKVLGVDPAQNIAAQANAAGIETLPAFFNLDVAKQIRASHGPAKVVCANHVFAHVNDMQGFVDGVRHLLAPDGTFVFEVGYLVDVFEKSTFDTIYHEHLDYHRVGPLLRFFAANGLEMFDAERSTIQGGSLRGYAGLPGVHSRRPALEEFEANENRIGLDRPATFLSWADRIRRSGVELTTLLSGLKAQGKSVAAYGLPAKATTLMYHFGLDQDTIAYIVDDAPLKVGLYSPGLHVPIVGVAALYEQKPDYVVILAWNFADALIERHRPYLEAGGRFIVPLPNLAIH